MNEASIMLVRCAAAWAMLAALSACSLGFDGAGPAAGIDASQDAADDPTQDPADDPALDAGDSEEVPDATPDTSDAAQDPPVDLGGDVEDAPDVVDDALDATDDGGTPDRCTPPATGVLATYRFDDNLRSRPAGIPAAIQGETCFGYRAGRNASCGKALEFGACDGLGWIEIPNAETWDDLEAIDFWLKPGPTPGGVLSRDAEGDHPGDITVFVGEDGRLGVRLQSDNPDQLVVLCSEDRLSGEWTHIGINFGPSEPAALYVDGTLQQGGGQTTMSFTFDCSPGSALTFTVEGNTRPWVVGAAAWLSPVDAQVTPTSPLSGAGLDHLRFSSEPQPFDAWSSP